MSAPVSPSAPTARRFCWVMLTVLSFLIAVDRLSPFVLPLESFYFRPWEYMTGAHRFGLRAANTQVTMRAYGDLANMIGLRRYRVDRDVTHTLDAYGMRNTPLTQHAKPSLVIVGDSFVAGGGNTDADTLAVHVQQRLPNEAVTAYAHANMPEFLADPRWRAQPPRVVVWQKVERNLTSWDGDIERLLTDTHCFQAPSLWQPQLKRAKQQVKQLTQYVAQYTRVSYLRRVGQQLFAEARFALLGVHSPRVTVGTDDQTLFFTKAITYHRLGPTERELDRVAVAIEHAQTCLQDRGMHLVFLPIPDKSTVYNDLVPSQLQFTSPLSEEPLTLLHRQLLTQAVDVVELLPVFQQARSQETERLYWPDDTHWNGHGVALTAETLVSFLRRQAL